MIRTGLRVPYASTARNEQLSRFPRVGPVAAIAGSPRYNRQDVSYPWWVAIATPWHAHVFPRWCDRRNIRPFEIFPRSNIAVCVNVERRRNAFDSGNSITSSHSVASNRLFARSFLTINPAIRRRILSNHTRSVLSRYIFYISRESILSQRGGEGEGEGKVTASEPVRSESNILTDKSKIDAPLSASFRSPLLLSCHCLNFDFVVC